MDSQLLIMQFLCLERKNDHGALVLDHEFFMKEMCGKEDNMINSLELLQSWDEFAVTYTTSIRAIFPDKTQATPKPTDLKPTSPDRPTPNRPSPMILRSASPTDPKPTSEPIPNQSQHQPRTSPAPTLTDFNPTPNRNHNQSQSDPKPTPT